MALVKAIKLWKSFNETGDKLEILKGLDLEINDGDIIAVTGESGSGKSTLLHILGLLDEPDSGEIFFKDQTIKSNSKKADSFRNKELGFVFQFHYLLPDFNALENIALPNFYLTGDLKKAKLKAEELLNELDIIDRKEHYPEQLSGGEQQRVAVARALINDPSVIFMDEPTGNLDKKHSDELIALLLKINRTQGRTMVIVTHDQDFAMLLQKHYILENGVLVLT